MNELLEIRNLTKKYPSFTLDKVSFFLKKGEIMGLIGRNGAGKTTILKSLLSLIRPDCGDIRFFDNSLKKEAVFTASFLHHII